MGRPLSLSKKSSIYITITSVVHVVRYRRYNSPVMSAAKRINLVAALVSMLSLETAMLARFGSREDAPCQYTAEEMQQRLQQVETRILQGDPGLSNEEVEKELLEEMPWLK